MGQWTNQDGLPLNFGVSKSLPELAGDYRSFGTTRVLETYITLGPSYWGPIPAGNTAPTPTVPAMASTFSGGGTPAQAGIISLNNPFPLMTVGGQTASNSSVFTNSGGVNIYNFPQVWVDGIDLEVLQTFTNSGATTFSVGLVAWNPTTSAWVQVTPNTGAQFIQTATIANLAAGRRWQWGSDPSTAASTTGYSPWGSTSSAAPTVNWVGNIPQITNSITPLPSVGYLSAIANGSIHSTAAGLARLRVYYNIYGNISQ